MLHKREKFLGTVIQSINLNGGDICVDFFKRPNGTYGYEEYRRDTETLEGWFPIGFYSGKLFDTYELARQDAMKSIAWLAPSTE